jgi:hypothetical protein
MHEINSLNFYTIDESVTANPEFYRFFSQKAADFRQKWPLFRLSRASFVALLTFPCLGIASA